MAEYLCEEDMNTGEYISRDLALRQLNSTCLATDCDNYNGVRCRACEYADAMDFIDAIPAADVQPIKRGRWDFQGYQLFKCTNCKEMFTQDQLEAMQNHKDCEEWTFPNFCPNCGSDMRGDENGTKT